MNAAILSVIYHEPDWIQTVQDLSINAPGVPVFFVDRGGIGSLAEAINRGFASHALALQYEVVWVITNIRFGREVLPRLINTMLRESGLAAIHPAFDSDHLHLRPQAGRTIGEVPFVEFTAPLVRSEIFARCALDERMPYAGHDLDWGYRVRQQGYKLAVQYDTSVKHTYIRNIRNTHPITLKRKQLRMHWEQPTKDTIRKIYGPDHTQLLGSPY